MDTTQEDSYMEKTLSNLAADLLCPILDLLDGYSLMSLLICGDSRLSMRLQQLPLHFDLKYDPRWVAKFPALLRRFHQLKSLRLKQSEYYGVVYNIILDDIPNTVESIHFEFGNGLTNFLVPTSPSYPASDPHHRIFAVRGLASRFPYLKSFHAKLSVPDSGFSIFVEPNHLPSGLTDLSFFKLPINIHKNDFPLLPTSLTSIDCIEAELDQSTPLSLPPGLIRLRFSESSTISWEVFSALPDRLTELKIESVFPSTGESPDFTCLPRQLVTLTITVPTLRERMIEALPRSLTDLFLISEDDTIFDVSFCKQLPQALKRLILWVDVDMAIVEHLPPSITDFSAPTSRVRQSVHTILSLPPNLTTTAFIDWRDADGFLWRYLPGSLRQMTLNVQQPCDDFAQTLPPAITQLTLESGLNIVPELPFKSLTKLTLKVSVPFGSMRLLRLPTLRVITFFAVIFLDDFLAVFCDSMQHGEWNSARSLEKVKISRFEVQDVTKLSDHSFRLPPSLTSLSVDSGRIDKPGFLESLIATISSSSDTKLRCLKMGYSSEFQSHHVDMLPRSLRTLSLEGSRCSLSHESFSKFPKGLTDLTLPATEMIQPRLLKTLMELYPGLTRLQIGRVTQMRRDMVHKLILPWG